MTTRKNKFGSTPVKDARLSLIALIVLIWMIIFMVLPTAANAANEDEIVVEFTKVGRQVCTAEYEVILKNDSWTIPVFDERPLTIDRDAELYTLEEVLYQVTAIDKEAAYRVIRTGEKYIFEVTWSRSKNVPHRMELIEVGEEFFICRGEDFRSLMINSIFGKSV